MIVQPAIDAKPAFAAHVDGADGADGSDAMGTISTIAEMVTTGKDPATVLRDAAARLASACGFTHAFVLVGTGAVFTVLTAPTQAFTTGDDSHAIDALIGFDSELPAGKALK